MIFYQNWEGKCITDGVPGESFKATVPGNIQLDYANANNFGDVNYDENCKKFKPLESYAWIYRTELKVERNSTERVFFVTHGIEYKYDIILNSKKILHHIGMFSKVEYDITDLLADKNILEVYIYPHPKREDAMPDTRDEADQSCKPAVEYGWDWEPRLLVSGIWNDTYIETRKEDYITDCEVTYKLNDCLTSAEVYFDIDCNAETKNCIYAPDGTLVYSGTDKTVRLDDIKLWWCNGQGEPDLYKWTVKSNSCEKSGFIGFKKVKLVMSEGAWDEPDKFPKSRSVPPFTIELNGRKIFAKGSNWVNPEVFTGTITKETYEKLIVKVKDANMNILRCWGGAIINKEPFFELCDKMGIMVWQEFPLACNNYVGSEEYLKVLESEATHIIKRIKNHACHVLWCGGNELFNGWSKMTEQSKALRLLDKLCYENDPDKPFIMTSPLMGVAHGPYTFYSKINGKDVFEIFRESSNTAYTEFGVPAISDMENLKRAIPGDIINNPMPDSTWETHNGFGAFPGEGNDTWLCIDMVDSIFGKQKSIEDYIEKTNFLQREGLKFIFEEARRQKPRCSMAINWCFNEPWINVANESVLMYPARERDSYFAVKDALRPVLPSAALEHFRYSGVDWLNADLWLLNDSNDVVSDTIDVYFECDGVKQHVITWNTGIVEVNTNKRGHKIQIKLPDTDTQVIKLILKSNHGDSEYCLLLNKKHVVDKPLNALNI